MNGENKTKILEGFKKHTKKRVNVCVKFKINKKTYSKEEGLNK